MCNGVRKYMITLRFSGAFFFQGGVVLVVYRSMRVCVYACMRVCVRVIGGEQVSMCSGEHVFSGFG